MVLEEATTEINRLKCKTIILETPFEVVYTIAEGKTRPVAVGKQVVERDSFTYQRYLDTSPSSPTLSSNDFHEAGSIVMLTKSSSMNIRLIVFDYAGLTTNPEDLLKLIKKLKSIKEIVIYNGHIFEILSRQQLLHGEAAKKFDCRAPPIERSTL
ncbi:hypothetical protein CU097_005990 [Rhizopus azygosporus]|uniref:Uncharacterized protein n=1 Tax=Rhizopus azygosporus TaxID=86630 RepID=A0A367JP25_RHIAZ|nr:hypothetical protein CU097_005990 [Rhizopus azygosporus]